jgi:hypothetical protein
MTDQYRRLAVFVDSPGRNHFIWLILESSDDPAVWLDLETGDEAYGSWIEAHEAGNAALLAYVDDVSVGPVAPGALDDGSLEED